MDRWQLGEVPAWWTVRASVARSFRYFEPVVQSVFALPWTYHVTAFSMETETRDVIRLLSTQRAAALSCQVLETCDKLFEAAADLVTNDKENPKNCLLNLDMPSPKTNGTKLSQMSVEN